MSDDPVVQAPARLMEEPTDLGSLMTQSEAEFRGNLDEGKAWQRIKPSLETLREARARRVRSLGVSAGVTLVAMTVGWYAGVRYAHRANPNGGLQAAGSQVVAPVVSMALNNGESVLSDGTRILVGNNTQGRYIRDALGARIILEDGSVDVFVPDMGKHQAFAISCAEFEVSTAGARFSVSFHTGCVLVDVAQGSVSIAKAGDPVRVTGARDQWASEGCRRLVH